MAILRSTFHTVTLPKVPIASTRDKAPIPANCTLHAWSMNKYQLQAAYQSVSVIINVPVSLMVAGAIHPTSTEFTNGQTHYTMHIRTALILPVRKSQTRLYHHTLTIPSPAVNYSRPVLVYLHWDWNSSGAGGLLPSLDMSSGRTAWPARRRPTGTAAPPAGR